MNPVMSRRRLLFGGTSLGGAALSGALSGGALSGGSLRLISPAMGQLAAPASPIRMSSNENPYGPSR
jgi:hypothetical protein